MANFNPLTASVREWEQYLLDPENLGHDYLDNKYNTSPFKRMIDNVCSENHPFEVCRKISKRSVQAVLNVWNEISNLETVYGISHPFEHIPILVCKLADSHSKLISVAQRLWVESPKADDLTD